MKRKSVILTSIGFILAIAVTAFVILPIGTAQAQDIQSTDDNERIEELQASIDELRGEIEELRALISLLVQNMGDETNIPTTPSQTVPPPTPESNPMPQTGESHITARLDEAGAAAIRTNGGRGLIRHICLDWEHGLAVYHVRLYDNGNRVDIYLDRNDFSVVRNRSRHHNNASPSSSSFQRRQMNTTPTLTFNQAAEAALSYFGGGRIDEISRSYLGGRGNTTPVFDVDIITTDGERWCVYVDLHNGEILNYHRD